MIRLARLPVVLVAGLLVAIGIAIPASAHTQLIGVDPADGATVGEGTAVTLTFSEDLLTIGAEFIITDGLGAATKLDAKYPTAASVQVVLPGLAPGTATLAWRVVAGDGHPVEGSVAYVSDAETVIPPSNPASAAANPTASPSVSASPGATASPDAVSPSAEPSAAKGDSSGFNNVALWVAIFAAVLASSVAIIAAKRRR